VVGAVIGVGVLVRGFTPTAVFADAETPALSEICCAYGLIVASTVIFSVFLAATVAAVFVLGEVTSAYAAAHPAFSDAMVVASPEASP
jgi:hypothetical protein